MASLGQLLRRPPRGMLLVLGVPSVIIVLGEGPNQPRGAVAVLFWAAAAFSGYLVVRGLMAYARKSPMNTTNTAVVLLVWPASQTVYNFGPDGTLHDAQSASEAASAALITAMFIGLALLSALELVRRRGRMLRWVSAPRRWFVDAKASNLWLCIVVAAPAGAMAISFGIRAPLDGLIVVAITSPFLAAGVCSARELRRRRGLRRSRRRSEPREPASTQ
jgi:hypothetical protein